MRTVKVKVPDFYPGFPYYYVYPYYNPWYGYYVYPW